MFQQLNRVVAAGLTAVAVLGGAPGVQAAEVRNVGERTFPFEPGGQVVIESQNGRIVVEAWDKPQIRVQITRTVRAGDEARAKELMKGVRADVEVRSDQMRIRSRYPKIREKVGIWDLIGGRVAALQVHYYLQVPRNTSFSLETSNGEIRVRGTRGDLEAATVNGDLEITGVGGSLELQTTNGEIRLAGIQGSAVAVTTNGGVMAGFASVSDRGAVDLGTTNGNVEVTLPASVRASFEAATTNGRVSVAGLEIKARGAITSKSVQGVIGGGGGARIALRTTNGNIDVASAGARRKR